MDKLTKKNELGDLLKQWRGVRGRSQLDISVDTGISQRQISFIESGRSVPSRPTLMGIAQALEIPLRERNALLLAAGYAPLYSDTPWNSDEMKSINRALDRIIAQHEPYPAIVMDRYLERAADKRCSSAVLQLLHRYVRPAFSSQHAA